MKTKITDNKVKNYLYSGVGVAAHSKEIIQNLMKGLIREGRLNETDGKRIVTNAIKNMEKHLPDIEGRYNRAIHKIITLANAEIQMLQKNVEKLEQRSAPAARTVAKKVLPKRRTTVRKVAWKATHKTSK